MSVRKFENPKTSIHFYFEKGQFSKYSTTFLITKQLQTFYF